MNKDHTPPTTMTMTRDIPVAREANMEHVTAKESEEAQGSVQHLSKH